MKKTILIIMALCLMMVIPSVLAEDVTTVTTTQTQTIVQTQTTLQAGLTPDSPLYQFDLLFDGLRYNFALKNKKSKIAMEIAEERQQEMEQMLNQNKLQEAQIAQNKMQERIKNVEENIENADIQLKEKVQERLQKHEQNLQRVLANAPEQAKKGLQNAIANAQQTREKTEAKIQNKIKINESEQAKVNIAGVTSNLNVNWGNGK